jgi:hypothetical protein
MVDTVRHLECGCEYIEETHKLISLCVLHGTHERVTLEHSKLPRASSPKVDREQRDRFICAILPDFATAAIKGTPIDSAADQVIALVHAVQSRLA